MTIFGFLIISFMSTAQVPAVMAGRTGGQATNMGRFYGKVVDLNNKGIDGATIQLKGQKLDPNTKKTKEAVLATLLTANNGDFSIENLPLVGSFKLMISSIGYKKIEKQISFNIKMGAGQNMQEMIALADKDLGNIKLEEDATQLQSVTVTSTAKPQFEMGIDRKIFNVDKNLTSTGQTAVEVMKNIPNLNVDIDGNVTLRNAAPTLLIDNRPTTLTMDQIPADIIDRVEIITNPSAKYDATGGNAGILNIVLKKNKKNGYNGGLRSGLDMRGKVTGGGDLNVRSQKLNFSLNANVNGRKSISESVNERTILGALIPTKVSTKNNSTGNGSFNFYRAGVDYFPDNRNTFSLYGNIMKGSMGSNGTQSIDSLISGDMMIHNEIANSSQWDFTNKGGQLSFKHLFAEKGHEISADLNYNQSNNENWSIINATNLNQTSKINQKSLGSGNNKNTSFNIDYAKEFKNDVKFETGLRYNNRSEFNSRDQYSGAALLPRISNKYDYSEKLFAAYTNANMKLNNFSFQLGLRAESREYNGNILNSKGIDSLQFNNSYPISLFPSAFINYKKNDKEDIQLNYSKRISPPNFFQMMPFPDYSDPQNISVGNPNLKPQFTHSFEVAYNNAYKKGANFLATAYYKYSTDLITSYIYRDINPITNDSAYFSSSMNANTALVYGLELSNKIAVTKWWDMNLSFNLFKSSIQSTIIGQDINNDLTSWFSKINNTFKLPNGFSYQLSGQYQAKTILPPGGSGGGGGRGMGGGGFGGPQSTAQGYNLPYYDFDMAIKKDWTLSGGRTASLSLNVSDVFKTRINKSYSESQYFIQNSSRLRDQQMFRLNFNYRFGKFDVTLLKRKSNKSEEGGGMDQMPQ